MKLAGCYTALVTPFTEDGNAVDQDRLKEQISIQADGGVSGIVPCGTTGESPTLSDAEWESVVRISIECGHDRDLTVIAGTGSNSTRHAVELQKRAFEMGADAGLSVNPYYNKPTQDGLYSHFMAVADAANLPVILYNIPGRSGVALEPTTAARLATHPNIVAVKEATGSIDSASAMLAQAPHLTILSGDDTLTLPFASIGGSGVVSVISNIMPNEVQSMCNAFLRSDWDDARQAHYELLNLARGLLSLATNPIPLKAAMSLLGRDSGVMRLPMNSPSDEILSQIRSLLITAQML